jgi:hypothetical protein
MHCLHTVLFYRLSENSVLLFGNKSDIKATEFLRSTNRFYFKEVPGTRTAHREEEEEEKQEGVGGRMRFYNKTFYGPRQKTVQVLTNATEEASNVHLVLPQIFILTIF